MLLVGVFAVAYSGKFLINPRVTVLIRVSIAMRRHHYHSNSYKGMTFNRGGLHFQMICPLHHAGHGGMQADVVLEKKPSVCNLSLQTMGGGLRAQSPLLQ